MQTKRLRRQAFFFAEGGALIAGAAALALGRGGVAAGTIAIVVGIFSFFFATGRVTEEEVLKALRGQDFVSPDRVLRGVCMLRGLSLEQEFSRPWPGAIESTLRRLKRKGLVEAWPTRTATAENGKLKETTTYTYRLRQSPVPQNRIIPFPAT